MRILKYTDEQIFPRPEIVKRLKFLTNGGWGRHPVGSAFMGDLEYQRPGTYFLVWESGKIIAWALMCKRYDHGYHPSDTAAQETYQFGCYVSPKFRRLGIASSLALKALSHSKERNVKLVGCPWNRKGHGLYRRLNMQVRPHWS